MQDNVLLVFPSIFSLKMIPALDANIRKTLEAEGMQCKELSFDGSLLAVDVDDTVKAASVVVELFGVDKVAVATKTASNFNDLVNAIIDVGKKIVREGETFAVSVSAVETPYVGRDVEFAAISGLINELSAINARAASEEDCDRMIYAYASGEDAYACIFVDNGLGGLPAGSQNEEVMCSVHNGLSTIACISAIRGGFTPRIVLLKTDETTLQANAKNIELIARKLGTRKIKLDIVSVEISTADPPVLEKLSAMILARLASKYNIRKAVLPLSVAIFPAWFIAEVAGDVSKTAMPWLPLVFMADELNAISNTLGLDLAAEIGTLGLMSLDAEQYARLVEKIDLNSIVDRAVQSMRTMEIEIGPNYLHDIIDSVTV